MKQVARRRFGWREGLAAVGLATGAAYLALPVGSGVRPLLAAAFCAWVVATLALNRNAIRLMRTELTLAGAAALVLVALILLADASYPVQVVLMTLFVAFTTAYFVAVIVGLIRRSR
jgi:hypothetical protein